MFHELDLGVGWKRGRLKAMLRGLLDVGWFGVVCGVSLRVFGACQVENLLFLCPLLVSSQIWLL